MVEQWSRNQEVGVQNQVSALVPFGKALILITKCLGEDFKAAGLLAANTYKHIAVR